MAAPRVRIVPLGLLFLFAACGGENLNGVKHKAPVVSAGSDVQTGPGEDLPFHATATTDGGATIAKWAWDFGDGAQATTQDATHAYAMPGVFHVKVTATDDVDASGSATLMVTVTNAPVRKPPVPVISGSHNAVAGMPLTLDGTKSTDPQGQITSFSWAYSDNTPPDTNPTSTHTFGMGGAFTVQLTVTNDAGLTATSAPWQITVSVPQMAMLPSPSSWDYGASTSNMTSCGGPFVPESLRMTVNGSSITIVEGGLVTYSGPYVASTRHFTATNNDGLGTKQTLDATFTADFMQFSGNYLITTSLPSCSATIPIAGHRTAP